MSSMVHDELEQGLRELFERQAEAMPMGASAWDDPPMVEVVHVAPARRARPVLAAILATAAAVALVVGLAAISPGGRGVPVAGQPGVPVPLAFHTRQVTFAADGMSIEAGGHNYSAGGSTVDVNSDPGTPNHYTTLELTWSERGVEMRLYVYFTSDGHDWWANEIRTYNGGSPGDWIEYTGAYFRAPLGRAFTGNVDLSATGGNGHIRLENLRLQAFLPPAACKAATTQYVLDPSYDHVDLVAGANGFGLGTTALLDTASCTAVTDPHAFTFDWLVANPAIVKLETYDGNTNVFHAQLVGTDPTAGVDLYREGVGSTTVRVTARIRSTGKIVATAEIPVTVG